MKDILLKVIHNIGVTSLLRTRKKDSLTVLCLHRISDDRDFFFNPIKIKTFDLLLEYITKHYSIVSFSEVEKPTSKPKLILSFDDGYYDFIENALPLLIKKGIPSNHNIVNTCANSNTIIWTQRLNDIFNYLKNNGITNDSDINKIKTYENNWTHYYLAVFHHLLTFEKAPREQFLMSLMDKYNITSNYRMMNWDDVKYISENDVEIGSHTYSHDPLSIVNNEDLFKSEIQDSITEISNKINKKVNILSLPNGITNSKLTSFIERSEIEFVLLVNDKINSLPINKSTNYINRVYLMDNPIHETILRTELFHSIVKR